MLEPVFQRYWSAIALVWFFAASVSAVIEAHLLSSTKITIISRSNADWRKPIKTWRQKLWRFGRAHWPVLNVYRLTISASKFGVEANGKRITPFCRADSTLSCRMWTRGTWIAVSVVGVRPVRARAHRTQRGSMRTSIGHGRKCV